MFRYFIYISMGLAFTSLLQGSKCPPVYLSETGAYWQETGNKLIKKHLNYAQAVFPSELELILQHFSPYLISF